MARGLDAILQRIKDNASVTLVRRYLALVSELPDEGDKARRMLAVAQAIQAARPSEALRIAYLVYSMGREVLQALEIMIAVLETRGRSEKLKSLCAERDRLLATQRQGAPIDAIPSLDLGGDELDGQPMPDRQLAATLKLDDVVEHEDEHTQPVFAIKAPNPPSLRQSLLQGENPADVLARLPNVSRGGPNELGPGRERIIVPAAKGEPSVPVFSARDESDGSRMLDQLFASPPEMQEISNASEMPATLEKQSDLESMPQMAVQSTEQAPHSAQIDIFEKFGKPFAGFVDHSQDHAARSAALNLPPPQVPATDLGAAVQLFDHYWRQGYIADAREVLVQTAPVAAQDPWWQARNSLLQKSAALVVINTAPPAYEARNLLGTDDLGAQAAHRLALGLAPAANMQLSRDGVAPLLIRDADWRPLYSELLRIVARRRLPLASTARFEAYCRCLAGKALPEGFLKALAAAGGEHLTQHARNLMWDLMSNLWRGGFDEASHDLLKLLHLHGSEPRWLGIYLDALMATGRASQVMHAFRIVLNRAELMPRLEWAKVGMPRVQAACEQLGVIAPQWHEDEGIEALLKLLVQRPRPRLASLVAAADHSEGKRRSAA